MRRERRSLCCLQLLAHLLPCGSSPASVTPDGVRALVDEAEGSSVSLLQSTVELFPVLGAAPALAKAKDRGVSLLQPAAQPHSAPEARGNATKRDASVLAQQTAEEADPTKPAWSEIIEAITKLVKAEMEIGRQVAEVMAPDMAEVVPLVMSLQANVSQHVVEAMAPQLAEEVPPVFNDFVPTLAKGLAAIITGEAEQLSKATPAIVEALPRAIMPAVMKAAPSVIAAKDALAEVLPNITKKAAPVIAKINETLPTIVEKVKEEPKLIKAVPKIVTEVVPVIAPVAVPVIAEVAPELAKVVPALARAGQGVSNATVQAGIGVSRVVNSALANITREQRMKALEFARVPTHGWPSGRGAHGRAGWSWAMHAPFELNESLAWSWQHPEGRFHTLGYGTAIDTQGFIYLTAADGLRKFSPGGAVLWEYKTLPAEVTNAAALGHGNVYATDTHGRVFAVNMATGQKAWSTKVSDYIAQDNGFVTESDGVVVAATDSVVAERNQLVRGFNATDGTPLWAFRPDVNVWNFMASFPGDGSLLFQDQTGKAYRLRLSDGELIWKKGGFPGSWTDGTAAVANNGVFYTVFNNGDNGLMNQYYGPDHEGTLCARDVVTGDELWNVTTPRPPNNAPAVGRILGYPGLSVVQPMGQQNEQGAPTDVYAYDALSGDLRWVFRGPSQRGEKQAGDIEGTLERVLSGVRFMCLPNPWSAPTIDASGTVFIGNQDGKFFALRDSNGDGEVFGPDEVSSFDTKAAFSGSAGPSLAKNRVVVASCDSLYVFGE